MEVSTKRFPYISLVEGHEHACSAVAITRRHILTVASCIVTPGNSTELIFGSLTGGVGSGWTLVRQVNFFSSKTGAADVLVVYSPSLTTFTFVG